MIWRIVPASIGPPPVAYQAHPDSIANPNDKKRLQCWTSNWYLNDFDHHRDCRRDKLGSGDWGRENQEGYWRSPSSSVYGRGLREGGRELIVRSVPMCRSECLAMNEK